MNNINNINKPKLYFMVGLSASGKSSVAKEIAEKENCVIISSDDIRGQICTGGVADQSKNEEVFKIFHRRIKDNLVAGCNVIADATNIKIKSRAAIFNAVKDITCEKIAYIMTKPIEDCIKDNIDRKHPVPEEVIYRQMKSFQIPFYEEGFDKIIIHRFKNVLINDKFILNLYMKMKGFDQKNPHHTMTLYEHCLYTFNKFTNVTNVKILYTEYPFGALLHDVGKLYTQTFDENGIAHYYNHENYGTYLLLSNIDNVRLHRDYNDDEILNILFLINYHMMPFNWKSEKAHNKWKKIFGDDKYQILLDFHECDKSRPNENKL